MKEQFKFTREWFQDKKNQVHTIQDCMIFGRKEEDNIIQIGEHFLVDLYPVYGNGENRSSTDVEIWEVENIKKPIYHKRRGVKLQLKAIRRITTGKQFGYPNGYWKVPENIEQLIATPSDSASQVVNDGLNISLKDNSSELSQMSNDTSLNNNIKRNKKEEKHDD